MRTRLTYNLRSTAFIGLRWTFALCGTIAVLISVPLIAFGGFVLVTGQGHVPPVTGAIYLAVGLVLALGGYGLVRISLNPKAGS